MNEDKEIFKDIPGYEGYYQASNFGRIKSLDRTIIMKNSSAYYVSGRILMAAEGKGYLRVALRKNVETHMFLVHQLIAMAFLNHIPNGMNLVIDHINGDKLDNKAVNLQIVTQKQNVQTCFRKDKAGFRKDKSGFSSKYRGVYWHKRDKKWAAQIQINGKLKHLGYFDTEIESHNAYQKNRIIDNSKPYYFML